MFNSRTSFGLNRYLGFSLHEHLSVRIADVVITFNKLIFMHLKLSK
jgi:hypothetical protein